MMIQITAVQLIVLDLMTTYSLQLPHPLEQVHHGCKTRRPVAGLIVKVSDP